MRIEPARRLSGTVRIPGDKSISHRYGILSAMASGRSIIRNYSSSQDCTTTLNCIRGLGADVEIAGNQVSVTSEGWKELKSATPYLDAGNSGTTIRLLSALLAACPHQVSIAGDESLNRRPMRRIIEPLSLMGGQIKARDGQYPPLEIEGHQLSGIRYSLPVASAQVKSCVLIAGLTARGTTTVVEHTASRDHTERALPHFGVNFAREASELRVEGGQPLSPSSTHIPGDLSSAVYFIAAALLIPGAKVTIPRVGTNPTRSGLLSLLEEAGAPIEKTEWGETNSEPFCTISVGHSEEFLEEFPQEVGGEWIPNLIDEVPILAVIGTRLKQGLRIRDAAELRKKESDRIHSVVSNLRTLGLSVEEFEDGLYIPPGQALQGGTVKSYGDHRIAMSFAIAGLISQRGVDIDNPGCVGISFPEFFSNLSQISSDD